MSLAVSISAIYRPDRIHLWVEDPVTREYLGSCWNDADVVFHIAGGNQGVEAILKDAQDQGFTSVFGFVDQDFGPTNRSEWLNPVKTFRRFVSGVHELENFLLDPDALAGCELNTGHRTPAEITQRCEQRAIELVWWMACRRVIKQLHAECCQGFLEHPKCPQVTDLMTAQNWIVSQNWFNQISTRADLISTPGEIGGRLTVAHAATDAELHDGRWRSTFSGKELFHHVRDYVYTHRPNASPTDLDTDVARSVARWQVVNNRVPDEVKELRTALRARLGI